MLNIERQALVEVLIQSIVNSYDMDNRIELKNVRYYNIHIVCIYIPVLELPLIFYIMWIDTFFT